MYNGSQTKTPGVENFRKNGLVQTLTGAECPGKFSIFFWGKFRWFSGFSGFSEIFLLFCNFVNQRNFLQLCNPIKSQDLFDVN